MRSRALVVVVLLLSFVARAEDKPRLTKSSILSLAKSGTSADDLVKKIKESDSRFELSIDQALALGRAGVPAAALKEMKARPLEWVEVTRGPLKLRAPKHWAVGALKRSKDESAGIEIDCRIEGKAELKVATLVALKNAGGLGEEVLRTKTSELFQAAVGNGLANMGAKAELEAGASVVKRDGLAVLSGHMRVTKGDEKARGSFAIATTNELLVLAIFLGGPDDIEEERSLADGAIASLRVEAPKAETPKTEAPRDK